MVRSLVAIGAIGLGGGIALSLMMRWSLEVQSEMARDPLETAIEERLGRRLVAPVRVDRAEQDGLVTVRMSVVAGLRKQRLARTAGWVVWQHMRGSKTVLREVRALVGDDGEGSILEVTVPRPVAWR